MQKLKLFSVFDKKTHNRLIFEQNELLLDKMVILLFIQLEIIVQFPDGFFFMFKYKIICTYPAHFFKIWSCKRVTYVGGHYFTKFQSEKNLQNI